MDAMIKNPKSLLAGAAVAGLLIFPSLASFTAPMMAQAAAPAAPPAPPAPPAATTSGNWVRWAPRNYNASDVKLKNIVGTVTVAVRNGGPMTLEVSGDKWRMKGLQVSQNDGELVVDARNTYETNSVWDWKHWFDFSDMDWGSHNNMYVKVTVPRGSNVDVDDLVGDANIGDTYGELHFEAAATKAHIGHVGAADISLAGAGRADIAAVDGNLHLSVGGSGKMKVGPVKGDVHASIAGSGDAAFGAIAGGMHLEIAGSGDVTAARVNGPTHIEIAGSGSVKIADGTADPLHVEIMGAGNFAFGGVAVDPHVEAMGSGTVKLKSYRGHLDSEGMANVQIGGQ
jgi:Putative auto-transporter adhesin, head GIN domain